MKVLQVRYRIPQDGFVQADEVGQVWTVEVDRSHGEDPSGEYVDVQGSTVVAWEVVHTEDEIEDGLYCDGGYSLPFLFKRAAGEWFTFPGGGVGLIVPGGWISSAAAGRTRREFMNDDAVRTGKVVKFNG